MRIGAAVGARLDGAASRELAAIEGVTPARIRPGSLVPALNGPALGYVLRVDT